MEEMKGSDAIVLVCLAPRGRSSFHTLWEIGMGFGNGVIWDPNEGILRKQTLTEEKGSLEKYAKAANRTCPFCAGGMRTVSLSATVLCPPQK